jgi:hypothetical protein
MTERVRAGAGAAVALAVEHADHPAVLEATAALGHLEGVRADLDARRDRLEADNLAALLAVWRVLVDKLDRDRLARTIARRLVTFEAADTADTRDDTDRKALAVILLGAFSRVSDGATIAWTATRRTFRDAIAAAQGEGVAAAVAHGGHQLDPTRPVNTGAAARQAAGDLEHVAGLWAEADGWIQTMLGYAAGDVARGIDALGHPDLDSVRGVLDGYLDAAEPRAVAVAADQLTGRAVVRGVLNLYAQAGIGMYDVVCAIGACPRCLDIESAGPYPVGGGPPVPVHPFCRCEVHPVTSLPDHLITPFLPED